ncbi:MAG: histidine phosphatase family protein [Candidatus Latescibacteria bacterium]|nr:histidine phosphatase family protein [Candidatus Latescibacterota bacterium]
MNELVIVRHGETSGRSSVRFYGSTDVCLSGVGRKQMELTGSALGHIPFKTLVVSPLSRSRDSAEIVLDGCPPPRTIVEEELREIDFGDWEGLTAGEIAERDPDSYFLWRERGSRESFPGGESHEAFFDRVSRAAVRVFEGIELPSLAVLHKGVIKGVIAGLLRVPVSELRDPGIELGSIHRLRPAQGSWELVAMNETEHLGGYRLDHS